MKEPTTVHQIWLGSEVPEREQRWIDTVKQWCNKSNIQHKLWNLDELKATYPDDPVWEFAKRLPDCVRKYVFLCDYFRLIVLNQGEMYLDTDISCHRKPMLNFNGHSVLCMGEYWDGKQAATAFIGFQDKFPGADMIKADLREKLKVLDESCLDDLPATFGPDYFRKMTDRLGFKPIIVGRHEATHIQWKNRGALIHEGAGAWV